METVFIIAEVGCPVDGRPARGGAVPARSSSSTRRRSRVRAGALDLGAALAVLLTTAACGFSEAAPGGRPIVVATTPVLADFVRQVGGTRIATYDVIKPNVDPHDYDPSPADLVEFAQASVVVQNGVGLEPWLDDAVSSSDSNAKVVDTSAGIALRHATAGPDSNDSGKDESGNADPHIWQDPRNAEQMVRTIRDALVAADPADAAVFRANAANYLGQLAALDRDVARETATVPPANRKVVTNHDAFGYYLDRYGLTYVGAIIPSFDTSAELSGKALSRLVAAIRAQHVRAVFSESSLPPRTAQTVARGAGVRVVSGEGSLYGDTLGPPGSPGDTYLHMVRHNTDVLVGALR
jgi:zinc/manganese transport system substrate-binding protein/manganese/iron transport system substrate-binding protein